MKFNKYLIIALFMAVLVAGCVGADSENDNQKEGKSSAVERVYNLDPQKQFVGEEIGDFHFIDVISNEQKHLDDVYEDKVVIIQSFSIGCPACARGIEDYNYLYDKYQGEIEVVYIDINPNDKPEDIIGIKGEFNGRDWLWVGYQGSSIPFYENYNFKTNDMTIIVDKQGNIVYADSFVVPLERIENVLKELV